jgi:alkylation response protein AidB-like acyl-CoA dehydrogenase
LAITEPYAGSDVANIQCEAKKTPDGQFYIVNGEKKWITNGFYADYFVTAVRTGQGNTGISVLLIERGPGVKTLKMDCMGMSATGTAFVTFEDVRVPVSNLLGKENQGFQIIMHNFNHERLQVIVSANRLSRVCYEESFLYASKRKTFGKRLIEQPIIRDKLAHMIRLIESTHAYTEQLVYQMAKMKPEESARKLGGVFSLLKVQSTRQFEYCVREASQIFGGLAYTKGGQGGKIERLFREARGFTVFAGSEEIMIDFGVRQALKQYDEKKSKL